MRFICRLVNFSGSLSGDRTVVLGEPVCVFLVRSRGQGLVLPQIGGQVRVGLRDRGVRGLGEIAEGAGGSAGGRVAVLDTGHVQKLLGNRGGHDSGTSGRRNETHLDGTALAGHLARHGVGLTDLVSPVSTTHRNDGELSENNRTADRGRYFLGALDAKTDMTVSVSDRDECLRKFKRIVRMGSSLDHSKIILRNDIYFIILLLTI